MSTITSTVDSLVDAALDFATTHKTITQINLLLLSVIGFSLMFSPTAGILLTVIVFVHELGHYIPSRHYGVGKGMYMLPLLGGVTLSDGKRYESLTSYQRFIIAFSGPATGLLFTVAGLVGWFSTGASIWLTVACLSSVLNFTNLLPLWNLDGRELLDTFSNSGWNAQIVAVCCLEAVSLTLGLMGSIYGTYATLGLLIYMWSRSEPAAVRVPMSGHPLTSAYVLYTFMLLGLGLPIVIVQMADDVTRSLVLTSLKLTTFGWLVMAVVLSVMIVVPLRRRMSLRS